jgi:uncharacterized metal-binding protein YceD (DUF177 family)
MLQNCKILIDRLKRGQSQKIDEQLEPLVLGPNEPELQFAFPVTVKGEAYIAETHLVIHLDAATKVLMPCAVCNQMIKVELKSLGFYHTEPLEAIPNAIFDYGEPLREALLIELPKTVECKGSCPERPLIAPYLRSEVRNDQYHPFADIDETQGDKKHGRTT